LCQVFGDNIVSTMLQCAGGPEAQVAMVNSYSHFESNLISEATSRVGILEQENVALSSRLDASYAVQQNLSSTLLQLRQSHDSGQLRPKPVKLEVPKFEGKDSDNLLRWILKVSTAAEAQLISDDKLRIAFAMSHMCGRAEDWAFTQFMMNPNCFLDWNDFVSQLREVFLPPNSDFRFRAKLLACRQGSRTIRAFAQEMRFLAACLSSNDNIPESTKVTVFMQGLKTSPAKTQLFRVYPQTLEEAIRIALSEDYSHKLAKSDVSMSNEESKDMDISGVEHSDKKKSRVKCYNCQKEGHFSRECKAPKKETKKEKGQESQGSARGTPAKKTSTEPQGNAQSQ